MTGFSGLHRRAFVGRRPSWPPPSCGRGLLGGRLLGRDLLRRGLLGGRLLRPARPSSARPSWPPASARSSPGAFLAAAFLAAGFTAGFFTTFLASRAAFLAATGFLAAGAWRSCAWRALDATFFVVERAGLGIASFPSCYAAGSAAEPTTRADSRLRKERECSGPQAPSGHLPVAAGRIGGRRAGSDVDPDRGADRHDVVGPDEVDRGVGDPHATVRRRDTAARRCSRAPRCPVLVKYFGR